MWNSPWTPKGLMPEHTNNKLTFRFFFSCTETCLLLKLHVLICFLGRNNEREIIHTQPKNNIFFRLVASGWHKQAKQNKQHMKQGETVKTCHPLPHRAPLPGQDQAEKLNGAHRGDMGAETCYRPPGRLCISWILNLIHSAAVFIVLCVRAAQYIVFIIIITLLTWAHRKRLRISRKLHFKM